MKKVFITSIVLLISLAASAAVQYNGLWYNLNSSNSTAEVVASQGTLYSGDISIPPYFYYGNTSYTVTSIGESAFEGCTGLTSIYIPSSVKTLEQGAFYGCSSITCVKIPEGVTKIGLGAFSVCTNLTSVIIPSSVNTIEKYAFDYCTNLNRIVSEIKQPFTIDKTVFDTHSSSYSVYSQATLVVPDGLKSAYKSKTGWQQFSNIKEASEQKARFIHVVKAGTLPDLISELEKYKIEELTITGELNGTDFWLIRDMAGTTCKTYEDRYGEHVDYVSTNGTLKSLNLSGVDIVEGGYYLIVPYSGPYTFEEDITDVLRTIDNTISRLMFYLTKLESIVLPKSITSIASDAFNNCSFLNSLMIESGNPYYDSRDNCNAIIEKSSNCLIAGCNMSIIPNSVVSIGDNAFYGCSGLTSITIPNNVMSIGSSAFAGCSSLSTIISEISTPFAINENVFDSNVYNYNRLIVPSGKKYTYQNTEGWNMFQNIVEYGGVGYEFEYNGIRYKIGENNSVSVVYKEDRYFGDVVIPSQIEYRDITYSVTSIEEEAFFGSYSLTSVIIPNSVKNIEDHAFEECRSLKYITISSSVSRIGYYAFFECSSLTSVHITDLEAWCRINFGYFGGNPLVYAHHLYLNGEEIKDMVIPNSITKISNRSFAGCTGLTSLTIPKGVMEIGEYAFSGCNEMSSVSISNSVTYIGSKAFDSCDDLVRIVSRCKVPPTCESGAFSSKAYCTLWVPKGCREAYLKADEWKDFKEIREIDGDINLDGKVNKADIDALVTYIMNGTPAIYGTIADLNDDEKVNAADVVTLIDLLNNGDLSMEFQPYFSNNNGNLVVTSITCTLKNNRKEAIQLTKCELYCNNSLVSYKGYSGGSTVAAGGSNDCSFSGLSIPASSSNFTVIWHYTYNGENYTYRCDLTE